MRIMSNILLYFCLEHILYMFYNFLVPHSYLHVCRQIHNIFLQYLINAQLFFPLLFLQVLIWAINNRYRDITRNREYTDLVFIHNHPSNETFSASDLKSLEMTKSLKAVVAVFKLFVRYWSSQYLSTSQGYFIIYTLLNKYI